MGWKYFSFITLLIIVEFSSCKSFDEKYYERISGVKLPSSAHLIETYDNLEFVTTTSFRIDKGELQNLITHYHFEKRDKAAWLENAFFGMATLKKGKPDFTRTSELFFYQGEKGKNAWLYIIDLEKNMLWAEIRYPDWGGSKASRVVLPFS